MTGTWVVTGGAGYIGGHVVAALRREAIRVVMLGDLSTGGADRSVADPVLIARELCWRARWDLADAVRSAWAATTPEPWAVVPALRRRSLQRAAAG